MAKFSPEVKIKINFLRDQLLDIIDEAKAVEFAILEHFGETLETASTLDQLVEISEQAVSRFSQLFKLQLRIAEAQPSASSDLLKLMDESIANIQNKIPALQRSIEEIKLDWRTQ